jgi:hypothetical protein
VPNCPVSEVVTMKLDIWIVWSPDNELVNDGVCDRDGVEVLS